MCLENSATFRRLSNVEDLIHSPIPGKAESDTETVCIPKYSHIWARPSVRTSNGRWSTVPCKPSRLSFIFLVLTAEMYIDRNDFPLKSVQSLIVFNLMALISILCTVFGIISKLKWSNRPIRLNPIASKWPSWSHSKLESNLRHKSMIEHLRFLMDLPKYFCHGNGESLVMSVNSISDVLFVGVVYWPQNKAHGLWLLIYTTRLITTQTIQAKGGTSSTWTMLCSVSC